MAETGTKDIDLDMDEERVLTIKISLEGPAELVSWIRENRPGTMKRRLTSLVPGEFREHMRAARHEQMLALRSLVDAVIGRLEREEKPRRRSTKIEVE